MQNFELEHESLRALGAERTPVDLAPSSTYEALTRQMVEHVAADVAAIRERVDMLFYVVISSVAVEVLLRLAGA
jgi:hypothetical protein